MNKRLLDLILGLFNIYEGDNGYYYISSCGREFDSECSFCNSFGDCWKKSEIIKIMNEEYKEEK